MFFAPVLVRSMEKKTSVQPNLVLGNIFGQSPRPLALRYNEVPLYITCRIILVPRGREKNDVHVESKKFKFSLLLFLTNASVAGISKNLREANETGKECDKKLTRKKRSWEGVRKIRSSSPPHFFPIFAHPRRAPSLARFFARLFDLRLEQERKRLLRRPS